MLDGCLALVLLSPMMCQIVWAGTGAGGGCWRSGSGPQRSRFMLHLWLPNWCNEACLLGSPPSSQQLAKAYMDGGGNTVALHLLWAAAPPHASLVGSSGNLQNPPTCVAPTCVTNCLLFHQWSVAFVTAAGESLLLPHCLLSQSCDWKLH